MPWQCFFWQSHFPGYLHIKEQPPTKCLNLHSKIETLHVPHISEFKVDVFFKIHLSLLLHRMLRVSTSVSNWVLTQRNPYQNFITAENVFCICGSNDALHSSVQLWLNWEYNKLQQTSILISVLKDEEVKLALWFRGHVKSFIKVVTFLLLER